MNNKKWGLGFFILLLLGNIALNARATAVVSIKNPVVSALTPFTMSISPTDASCAGNGEMEINISDAEIGGVFEFSLYLLPDTAIPFKFVNNVVATSTTVQTLLSALPSGNYRLQATEALAGEVMSKTVDITIGSTFVPLHYTVAQTVVCAGADLTVTTTAGTAVSYELREDGTNNLVFAEQASNTFVAVPPGTYLVRVKDNCDNIDVQAISIVAPTLAVVRVDTDDATKNNSLYGFKVLKDCNTIRHKEQLSYNGSSSIPAIHFPISVTQTITDPSGGPNTVVSSIWNSNADNDQETDIPYYDGEQYDYSVSFIDNCGTVIGFTDTIGTTEFGFSFNALGSRCSGQYLPFWRYKWGIPPYTVEILDAPLGFVTSDYNATFVLGSNTAVFTTGSALGSNSNPVPTGDYEIQITDACGHSAIQSRTVNTPTINPTLRTRGNYGGCEETEGSIRFYATNGVFVQVADLLSVTITNAPLAYTGPTDVSANIDTSGWFSMNGLPKGTYTFETTTDCGESPKATFEVPGVALQSEAEVEIKCGNFNLNYTLTSNLGYEQVYVQKYNESSGQWTHPQTGVPYTEGALVTETTAIFVLEDDSEIDSVWDPTVTDYSETFSSTVTMNQIGQFRIIANHNVFSNGNTYKGLEACTTVIDSFNVASFDISVNAYYTPLCVNGDMELVIDAVGAGPLQYRITEFNGNPLLIDNGERPVFSNLDEGKYTVEITDAYLNVRTFPFTTNEIISPVITPINLCDGSDGKLTVDGLSFLSIEWTKDNDPTVLANTNTLDLMNFNATSQVGTYYAHLSFVPDSNACINQTLSFTIANTLEMPNAGTGQTANLLQSDAGLENLFNYISGPYDNWGEWESSSNALDLNTNIWNAEGLPLGSYQFEYTVNGTCSGSESTLVTIHIIDLTSNDLVAVDDIFTLDCPQNELVTIGNVMDNDMVLGNAVPQADYTIALENYDSSGMLTLNTDGSIAVSMEAQSGNTYSLTYLITEKADIANVAVGVVEVVIREDIEAPIWTTAFTDLDVTVPCNDLQALEEAQNRVPIAMDNCDSGLLDLVKVEGQFVEGNCANTGSYTNFWTARDTSGNTSVFFSQTITVGCDLIKVYNIITANGDGSNDTLYIEGIECVQDNSVQIFNRWGNLVYEAKNYNNGSVSFNGTSSGRVTVNSGKRLPAGTYFYILEYTDQNNERKSQNSWLTITRPE